VHVCCTAHGGVKVILRLTPLCKPVWSLRSSGSLRSYLGSSGESAGSLRSARPPLEPAVGGFSIGCSEKYRVHFLFRSVGLKSMSTSQHGDNEASRMRRFCFTWNNYPLDAEDQLRCFFERKGGAYMVVGREKGASGTPHLQGYLHLKHAITFQALKRYLPTAHIERARGSGTQNQAYCTKDADFFEVGELPADGGVAGGEASKKVWANILSAAETGNWDFLKHEYPRVWVTMSEKLISKRVPNTTVQDGEITNEWWFGSTGTGKSRLAWEKYGTICYQKMLNKWWDGYDSQDVVVIEEWSPKNEVTASALKIWADRYPFTAQIKGGVLQKIRPRKIIVISNYRLRDCFPDTRDADPIARRFRELEFPHDIDEATSLADQFIVDVTPVGEPPDVTMASQGDVIEDVDDIPDLLAGVEAADVSSDPLINQAWVDCMAPGDFERFFLDGTS